MATLRETFKNIANAIRSKTGKTELITPENMATEISNISAGGGELKKLIDARKRCAYLFYKYEGNDISDLIKFSDTENSTDFTAMFYGATNLITIPIFDMSNSLDTTNMFYEAANLSSIPQLNTSNNKRFFNMFNGCSKLTTIPSLDTSNATEMTSMFANCISLTTVPKLNTLKNENFSNTFNGCKSLITIEELDFSSISDSGNLYNIFYKCSKLENLTILNLNVSNLDLTSCTALTHDSLVNGILNNLKDLTGESAKTIKLGTTNLAKLTDEEKLIATNKNWTLA